MDERELVVKLELEAITPIRTGNYKGLPYDIKKNIASEPFASSLKGVWRWWSRVAVVSACGSETDYIEAERYLSRIFGGVKSKEEISEASNYTVMVSNVRFSDNFERDVNQVMRETDTFFEALKKVIRQLNSIPGLSSAGLYASINPLQPKIATDNPRSLPSNKREIIERIQKIINMEEFKKYNLYSARNTQPQNRLFNNKGKLDITLHIPYQQAVGKYLQIPRVKLILMPRSDMNETDKLRVNDEESCLGYHGRVKSELAAVYTEGMKFDVSVYSRQKAMLVFVLTTLLLAIIFGGIGSFTKRGFGSLKINSVQFGNLDSTPEFKEIREIYEKIKDGNVDKESFRDILNRLVRIAIASAPRGSNLSNSQKNLTPKVPSLSRFDLEVCDSGSRSVDNLKNVGEAFLKNTYKGVLRHPSRYIHTWIYGLPRSHPGKGSSLTGYLLTDEISPTPKPRRISSIGVRFFGSQRFMIIYGMLSRDWNYDKLIHNGKSGSKNVADILSEKGENLESVYKTMFKLVKDKLCGAI